MLVELFKQVKCNGVSWENFCLFVFYLVFEKF